MNMDNTLKSEEYIYILFSRQLTSIPIIERVGNTELTSLPTLKYAR